jgi:hypothetical protein
MTAAEARQLERNTKTYSLSPANHSLFRRIQHLVRLKLTWEQIAYDVGCEDVKALVQWVNDYKGEPKPKPMVRTAQMLPLTYANKPIRTNREMAAAFARWRRDQPKVAKALDRAGL